MNQGDAEKIIDDVAAAGQKAADKAKRSASEAKDAASDKIAVARDRAVEALDSLTERANHYARRGLDKAVDMQHRAKREFERASDATAHYVEEQPLKSVAIAAGIGAAVTAITLLLLRDHHRRH